MFQAAYEQYVYTDKNFGSHRLLSPEASTQWTPQETKCKEDTQIGERYVPTCSRPYLGQFPETGILGITNCRLWRSNHLISLYNKSFL
jgi:hypothetical protein